jgi:hypothetical protein
MRSGLRYGLGKAALEWWHLSRILVCGGRCLVSQPASFLGHRLVSRLGAGADLVAGAAHAARRSALRAATKEVTRVNDRSG